MLFPEPDNLSVRANQGLFEGLISPSTRSILEEIGFPSFARSSDTDIEEYVQQFSRLWAGVGDGFTPDPSEVLRQMDWQESILHDLWKLALRDDFTEDTIPLVAHAPVIETANPFIVRSLALNRPVVVMSECLWNFICAGVMGVLHWAEGTGTREAFGLQMFRNAAASWVANDPRRGPSGMDLARATTMEMEVGVFGAGLADAVFTWAFLHEMGHFVLGHLPVGERHLGMTSDGRGTATSFTYDQENELAADAFGYDRFLGLMLYSDKIRKNLRFGPQIDHGPSIAFSMMDLACRLEGSTGHLGSSTHPAPLVRAEHLLTGSANRLSDEGREWYAYWTERFDAFRREVLR